MSAQDYYPFGMIQPGRSLTSEKYRYGFNGKENDNDIKGVGNQQDYGMRTYDPRVGKFLSVDPLTKDYVALTPYQFASDNPILNIDLDGMEGTNSNDINLRKSLIGAPVVSKVGQDVTKKLAQVALENAAKNGGMQALKNGSSSVVGPSLGLGLKFLGTFFTAMFSSLDAGNGSDKRHYERITTKSDELSPFELQQIRDRISRSEATPQDLLYKSLIDGRMGRGVNGIESKIRYDLGADDADLRGSGINFMDALKYTFDKTGVDRSEFEVTKWGSDQYGKSVPVEYRAKGGAEVSLDFAHKNNGPDQPHIGWQTRGKGKNSKVGHILLDYVPAGRSDKKP